VFEWLFKYPPEIWQKGHLVWLSGMASEFRLLIFLACAAAIWLLYRKTARRLAPWARRTVLGLRILVFALLVFVLGIPALRITTPRANSIFTAVLVDTSRSMSLQDVRAAVGRKTRMEAAREVLLGKDGRLGCLAALAGRTRVVLYAFDQDLRRVGSAEKLEAEGPYTNLFRAVRDMEAELRAVPVVAAVLLTDGDVNAGGPAEEAARILQARGIPLHVVGLGDSNPPRDYEVVRVFAPRYVRRNTEVEVSITLRHTGFNEPFELRLLRGDSILVKRQVEPARDSDLRQVKLLFTPDHEGTATYKVQIPPAKDEAVVDNNTREFVLDISDDRLPVLYIEGSPRMEYRFLRRALYRDPDFRVVGLLRLAKDRFYVQDAGLSEDFLKKGFPETQAQLYAFQAVILGDIEAGYFSGGQLALLEEFVRARGGGLLMLGGVNSFGLGKYADTGIAKMLPLEITARDGAYSGEQFRPLPNPEGLKHPVLHQAADPDLNRRLWDAAPPLIGLTPVRGLKAGASLLLAQEKTGWPVLAVQNYGAGRVGAFTSGGSWYWQVSMPASDEFHEKFWKQLVRWLVIGAKEQVTVELNGEVYARREPVVVRATVLDKNLQPTNDARVLATFHNPRGNKEELALDWILSEDGVYVCRYVPEEEGNYHVEVRVEGWEVKPARAGFMVSQPLVEFSDAGLKEDALRAMARLTQGRYYSLQEAGELPAQIEKAVREMREEESLHEDKEIWDLPVLLIAILVAACAEWLIRRRGGLA
jgi:uncharacterized membrane protein